ncbi:dicarboxylate/amino acid:cation symporter [Corynebacterium flavescens]|uniref:dicarboxylate/amino acid:cation symporter n=1 Tax=Corynebacterium flavescens TaxID=28028 RepID=UPI00289A4BE3|nr:dicarboxylate/amino acid:cation symporter [Corynebacterium flavescens]
MSPKGIANSLLFRIIVAIILGIAFSFFVPEWFGRIFATFNGLFSNFLGFFIPVLIFALVTPAIAGMGRGAGKWLGITVAISYGSTIVSGLIAYGLALAIYPILLKGQEINTNVHDVDEGALQPFFQVEMPAPFEVMSGLLLAFCIGVGMTAVKSANLFKVAHELEKVVIKVIWGFVVPLLPVFIFGMFLSLGMNGNLAVVLSAFAKVLVLAVVMTLVYLLLQYLVAGAVAGRNPFTALKNMAPAYFTALGTSSSAATIPVTLRCALKNGISKPVAGFVIPLCATIHLSGSMMKLTLYAFAIIYMTGMDISTGHAIGFLLLLAIMMVAAPGVPGGAVMVAVGLLQSNLGFDEGMVALMIAAYIAIDSVGTAANVTGDGAIALAMDKYARKHVAELKNPEDLKEIEETEDFEVEEIVDK